MNDKELAYQLILELDTKRRKLIGQLEDLTKKLNMTEFQLRCLKQFAEKNTNAT